MKRTAMLSAAVILMISCSPLLCAAGEAPEVLREKDEKQKNLNLLLSPDQVGKMSLSTSVILMGNPPGPASFVIPQQPLEEAVYREVLEDLRIMEQVLEDQVHPERKDGGNRYLRWGRQYIGELFQEQEAPSVGSLYLDGYGVLFLERVNFPLIPAAEAPEKSADEETGDEVWLRAKKKLRGEPAEPEASPAAKYDGDRVEELRMTLIETLRHASNIRHLRPTDSVIFLVQSEPQEGSVDLSFSPLGGGMGMGAVPGHGMMGGMGVFDGETETPAPAYSYMVVRAAKEDIDALAAGDLDMETFSDRVTVITY